MSDVIEFVSDYLQRKYHRPSITIMDGCCRKCLRGVPCGYDLKKTSIKELMKDGKIEAHQIASAFYTGSAYHGPYFKDMIINMNSAEIPCKYPGNCNLTCIICRSLITNGDDVELDIWPGFKAHRNCTGRCLYPCCSRLIPTLPAYLSLRSNQCNVHRGSKFQPVMGPKVVIPMMPMTPNPIPPGPTPDRKAFRPISLPISLPISQPISPGLFPPPTPTRLPRPLPEPRIVPEVVKKTCSFKSNSKSNSKKAKADKFDETGRSVNILNFFQSPSTKHPPPNLSQKKEIPATPEPRRFIKNKETGVIFGYWKGDQAYHIDTDQPLFTQTKYSNVKFDFTPPVSILDKLDDKLDFSRTPASEKKHKGGTSP